MIDPDRLKPFLRHDDPHVRRAVADYFAEGWSRDPEIMPLLVDAIDGLPVRSAREMIRDLDHLVVTDRGFDRLLDALGQWRDEGVVEHLAGALVAAPIELLKARRDDLVGHPGFPAKFEPRVRRRLMYDGWPADRLWKELETFSRRSNGKSGSELDMTLAGDLVAALARLDTPDDAALVARLDDPAVQGEWIEIFLVDLIGARGLRSAVPRLIAYFAHDDDYLPDHAPDALIRIGDPGAIPLAVRDARDGADDDLPLAATLFLGRFRHPDAVAAILELLETAEDETYRTILARALCEQFSARAPEVVLKEIDRGYDRTYTRLEQDLLPVLEVLGVDLPQIPAWRAERAEQDARLQTMLDEWEAEDTHTPTRGGPDAAEIDEETGVTLPIVREESRVGRNDPCPCGSGKKFKKCCGKS